MKHKIKGQTLQEISSNALEVHILEKQKDLKSIIKAFTLGNFGKKTILS